MHLLTNSENQVTTHHVWDLLAFLFAYNCISSRHALQDINVDLDFLRDKSLTAADWALLSHCFSLARAFIALRLHLHLHSKAHLYILSDLASSFALWACFHLAVFRSCPVAVVAVNVSVDVQTSHRAEV